MIRKNDLNKSLDFNELIDDCKANSAAEDYIDIPPIPHYKEA